MTFVDWLSENGALLWWSGVLSAAVFLGSLVAVPAIVARLPQDYFIRERRGGLRWFRDRPGLRVVALVTKNFFGVVFVLAGLAMLALPGQGLLTILVGVSLMDFPGKFALERWFFGKRVVHRSVNWIRRRAGRAPLRLPDAERIEEEPPRGEAGG